MQPNARVAARRRPTRIQVVLAAAWLIVSLAIGGMMGAQPGPDGPGTSTISTANQP
jgi:hypothetical protein